MAEKKGSRVKRDSWSKKTWFKIKSPEVLGEPKIIGETPALKAEQVIGRVAEIPLTEVTGSFKHHKYKVAMKITNVNGDVAETDFFGHEILRDFISRMVRRRTSRIDVIEDIETKDGKKARYKLIIITRGRVDTGVKKAIRKKATEILEEFVRNHTLKEVLENILNETLQRRLSNELKKIHPLNYVDVRKIERLDL